jgi:hypothetical protein
MPRFYLNIYNTVSDTPDEEGAEFSDLSAARASAVAGIRSFLSAELLEGSVDLHGHLEIVDEAGTVVETLTFKDVVEIKSPD